MLIKRENQAGSGKKSAVAGEQGKRWQRRSDARPAELLTAALRVFAERGFAATRLEDVAASAGVSKGTVYLYFESKEHLFEAVVREAVTPRVEQAMAFVAAFEGSTPNLIRKLFGMLEVVLEGPLPAVVKLIVAESGNFPELARMWSELAVQRIFALMSQVVQRGVDCGEFRAVDPNVTAPLLLAPVLVIALWKQTLAPHTKISLNPHDLLAAHVETTLRGLAAPGPTESTLSRIREVDS
jgi:AcrR family transcriptional regulator